MSFTEWVKLIRLARYVSPAHPWPARCRLLQAISRLSRGHTMTLDIRSCAADMTGQRTTQKNSFYLYNISFW